MEVEVWFTIKETDEAARMSRGWRYWPTFVLNNLQGIVLVAAMLIGGFLLLLRTCSLPHAICHERQLDCYW